MWFDAKRQLILLNTKMQRSPWRHVVMVTVGLFVIYIIMFGERSGRFKLPTGINLSKYEPFEPVAEVDFAEGRAEEPKIPKIIHWVAQSSRIHQSVSQNLKTFVKYNPDWTFYLWTENTSRTLIQSSLPELLHLWDDHSHYKHITARRFEMVKYIVMYQFGGVVLDLTARNYRSLDTAIAKYSCFIPPNSYEEAIITGVPYTVTNRVLFCRAKHPFFKLVLDNLHRYQHMSTAYDSVGEGFLMTHYQLYNALQRERDDRNIYIQQNRKDLTDTSPYFFQGELSRTHPDAVYVPNSVYFSGSSDPQHYKTYKKACANFFEQPFLYQRACVHMHKRGIERKHGQFAYIDLHNTVAAVPGFIWFSWVDIKSISPKIKLYGMH